MRTIRILAGAVSLLAAACSPVEEAKLCVFSATQLAATAAGDPLDEALCPPAAGAVEGSGESACPNFTVAPAEVFFVRHTLPAEVTAPGDLSVQITTPCATVAAAAETTVEIEHVGGVALFSRLAPPGAECSLVVTAKLANSETRCESKRGDATACADLATVCAPPAEDAGQ